MKLNEKDRCEINRIIGEALGLKSVPPSGSIYDPDGKHTSLVDFPDFYCEEIKAQEALKRLRDILHYDVSFTLCGNGGCAMDVDDPTAKDERGKPTVRELVYGEGDITGKALADMVVEWICPGSSCQAVVLSDKCDCQNAHWRLKPALDAALKQEGGESNGK